jgi:hypothetical protein
VTSGLLRVRSSQDLKISRCYGRLFPDPSQEQLYHIPSCDAGSAFILDLEHTGAAGLQLPTTGAAAAAATAAASAAGYSGSGGGVGPMALQFALQYSVLVPTGKGQQQQQQIERLKLLKRSGSLGSETNLAGLGAPQQQQQQDSGTSSASGAAAAAAAALKEGELFQLQRRLRVLTMW